MAFFKITTNKKGELQAKIQAYGKDLSTGERKLYVKRIFNEDCLTEAKFKKFVEKASIEFEESIVRAYENQTVEIRTRVLTFNELLQEWKANIRANLSLGYYARILEIEDKFNVFLKERGLFDKPISAITVRDIQLFLNSFSDKTYTLGSRTVELKKPLPKTVNFRQLEREGILSRNSSYHMNHNNARIVETAARKMCERFSIDFDTYFTVIPNERRYSQETIKGYRRMLRTLFNEAVRYEWITFNPVSRTKINTGNSNTSLRPIGEKEVFSFTEVQEFLSALDRLPKEAINQKVCLKIMLLTGVRNAELHGLRWDDIDFENKQIHVRRNRLYSRVIGIYEKEPKTKTSFRDIPIPSELFDELLAYREWFRLADDAFDSKLDQYYLAVGLDREPLYPQTIGNCLYRIEQKNGLKHVTCHGLRHTYCSLLLSQNVPIQTVSKYMGHSDSTITLKVYSHFIPDTKDRVIFALDSITKKK